MSVIIIIIIVVIIRSHQLCHSILGLNWIELELNLHDALSVASRYRENGENIFVNSAEVRYLTRSKNRRIVNITFAYDVCTKVCFFLYVYMRDTFPVKFIFSMYTPLALYLYASNFLALSTAELRMSDVVLNISCY